MLRSINHMRGFALCATDGEIGSVDDFLFDDTHWAIRYLVANTGSWLTGRLVLISPIAFGAVEWDQHRVDVNLSCAQIEHSPGIEADQPVARQHEEAYFQYYGYPYYWSGPGMWGMGMYPDIAAMTAAVTPANAESGSATSRPKGDPHLRSARVVGHYTIHARDGDLGHVGDFLVDDATWAIRSMVVDTRNWWPGKHVLVPTDSITGVSWEQASVSVDLTREALRHGPEYDPSQLNR